MSEQESTKKVIEESLKKLKKLGFKATYIKFDDNWIGIIITSDSVVNVITKLIDKSIQYPYHLVEFDELNKLIIIHFWKGEMPWNLKTKMMEKMK